MKCLTYCVAEQINLANVEQHCKSQPGLLYQRHWGGLELFDEAKTRFCYIFKNGTVIAWGYHRHNIKKIFDLLIAAGVKMLDTYIHDEFSYRLAEETNVWPHPYFNLDCISLESDDSEIKLAVSYGLSMSVKLYYYETIIEKLISRYYPFISKLAKFGRFKFSRERINKILGDILAIHSEINLGSNFLYQPKFFWQHPGLERYYWLFEKYLDISARAENINQQLDTLNEVFLMFNGYLENKHSHRLEIIIIVLITVEIIFSVLNLHF